MNKKIQLFIDDVIKAYKLVKPDWMPPHKTIYKCAKKHGLIAIIDGRDEKKFSAKWEKLFEDGDLEDDHIKVKLYNKDLSATLTFESSDLREIHVLN